jgi:hypothetical protein
VGVKFGECFAVGRSSLTPRSQAFSVRLTGGHRSCAAPCRSAVEHRSQLRAALVERMNDVVAWRAVAATSTRLRAVDGEHVQEPQARSTPSPASPRRLRFEGLLVIDLVVAIGVLLLMRAVIDELDFIGTGWLVLLALIPLAPLALPHVSEVVKALSSHVSSVKIGAVQFDLRDVRRDPITLQAFGVQAAVPNDNYPFQSTGLDELMLDLGRLRRQGGTPVVVIDLRNGEKWKRPNLYLFARLLDQERVAQLVFTKMRGERDGYLVGTCRPTDVVREIERSAPFYAQQASSLSQPQPGMAAPTEAEIVALLSPQLQPNDQVLLNANYIAELLGPLLCTFAVDGMADSLSEGDLRSIVRGRLRFVPATSDGWMIDIIDRDSVALAVARAALAH